MNCRTETANAKYPRSAGAVVPFTLPPNRPDYGLPLLLLAEALLLATPSIGFFGGVEREFVQLEHLANLDLAVLITVGNIRQID